MNKVYSSMMSVGGLLLLATPAQAKTVALWPLTVDASGQADVRCAISPANDLQLGDPTAAWRSVVSRPMTWSLPPNPDSGVHVFAPYSKGQALASTTALQNSYPVCGATEISRADSPDLFRALESVDSEWTIEGWYRLDNELRDPSVSDAPSYYSIFDVGAGGTTLFASVRYSQKNSAGDYYADFELYYRGPNMEGGDYGGFAVIDDPAAFVGTWHHIAYVHKASETLHRLYIYLDGVELGSTTISKFDHKEGAAQNSYVYLGGRSDRHEKCALAYWRISDTALGPNEFLCAAGDGPKLYPDDTTVAYWPLRTTADGFIDPRNMAGGSDISTGFQAESGVNQKFELELIRGVSAYKGQPPNDKIVLPTTEAQQPEWGPRCANGNQDCFGALKYPTYAGISYLNDATRADPHSASFTLEMYYCPVRTEVTRVEAASDESTAPLLTTMNQNTQENGWALLAVRDSQKGINGGTSTWRLVFMDSTSNKADPSTYVAYGDFSGGAYVEGDSIWRHLAVVYRLTGGSSGFGQWELFVDGVSCGTVDNVRAPAAKTNGSTYFLAGNGGLPGQIYGYFDSLVYSTDAITPNKFLCATEDNATNDKMKAFVPMGADATNPIQPMACCALDNTFFYFKSQAKHRRDYTPVPVADGPTVTNPDPIHPADLTSGAARFRNGSEGQYSLLSTRDPRVLDLFSTGDNNLTIEGYYRRTASIGDWEVLFAVYGENNTCCMASYRTGNRLCFSDGTIGKANDNYFNDAEHPLSDMTEWTHLAFVRQNRKWTMYQNGVEIGSFSGSNSYDYKARQMWICGRNERTWTGDLAELRISAGALTPDQFLCATKKTYDAKPSLALATQAFWRLDKGADDAADLANATLAGGYALRGSASAVDAVAVTRSGRRADDSNVFDDSRRPNVGSVVPEGVLTAKGLGANLEATMPFTVEGWLKFSAAPTDLTPVCGTWKDAAGWSVSFLPGTVAGKTSIAVKAANAGNVYADAVLQDAIPTSKLTQWSFFALSYDPAVGNGTWSFVADGKAIGSLQNRVKPRFGAYGVADFSLGAPSGLVSGLDVWRVSLGARSLDELLYCQPSGLVLLFR